MGWDLSLTASGFALAVDGKVESHGLILGKYDGIARLIHNRDAVCDKIDSVKPDLVIFEDVAHHANNNLANENVGMAWMIRAELFSEKLPYLLCAPSSLKKFVVGSGGSKKNPVTKDLVIKEIFKLGHDVNENNVADAIGLVYVGMALVGDWEPRRDSQREVLAKIRESNPSFAKSVQVGQTPAQPREEW
jgi:Holliday junction resolvasome RuvABC endonuclease subunit